MFKQPVEAKLSQRSSGADKKKLRRTAKDRFPLASDANIDEILPPKAEITAAKYSNKVHVYVIEGGLPMLFDIDGRGTEIYPTVYALWKLGSKSSWQSSTNRVLQIGTTTMSSSEALKVGLRGKALRITHYYHDFGWQSTV
ncbi:hypothetical protein OPV22_008400 [Ensete ventricosum]|uniref:Pre-PUA domain-containing protein n=1 Tax=Ensete ventricosum TaxID=4639 RepID=A0AAV8RGF7_ENSVE|nr:hypothetical protein OPV22_008400 [Ensete ventricosum]